MGGVSDMDGFSLGTPVLVCRWRLADRRLPLENRHLRALAQRRVGGKPVDANLVAWAKQHIEWTLASGAAEHPDGVLMLVLDEMGRAAMTVGAYEPLRDVSVHALLQRAASAWSEAEATGVAPETLWAVRGDELTVGLASGAHLSGATSLVADLARQLGMRVMLDDFVAGDAAGVVTTAEADGVFLVSDEHGVVVASGRPCARAERFAGAYRRLLEKTKQR